MFLLSEILFLSCIMYVYEKTGLFLISFQQHKLAKLQTDTEHKVNSNKTSCIVCFVRLLRAICCKIQRETGCLCAMSQRYDTQNTQSNNPFLKALGYVGEKLLRARLPAICAHTYKPTCAACVGAKDQSLIMEHPAARSRNSALNFAQHTHTHTHRHKDTHTHTLRGSSTTAACKGEKLWMFRHLRIHTHTHTDCVPIMACSGT